jgi:thiamine biosynthesis lipoprotein
VVEPTAKISESEDARVLVEARRTIMATEISIHLAVQAGQETAGSEAIADCFTWLKEVEICLTRFDESSELCRLNAAAGSWVAVSELLFTVLEESLEAAASSGGLFDPTLLTLLEALGYDRDFLAIAHRESPARPVREEWRVEHRSPLTGAWRRIQLDRRRRRVRLPLGARLDFGGIAKGWSADAALDRFFADFPDVLINVGGDMRARGRCADGILWPIGVASSAAQSDRSDTIGTVVTLGRGGIATSGPADRWGYRNGRPAHHLLDPRTGQPARLWIDGESADAGNDGEHLIAAATAFAPTAAHAEVAAKVALLRGYPAALQQVDDAWASIPALQAVADPNSSREPPLAYDDAGVALLLMLDTGEVVTSAHLQNYLTSLGGGGQLWLG